MVYCSCMTRQSSVTGQLYRTVHDACVHSAQPRPIRGHSKPNLLVQQVGGFKTKHKHAYFVSIQRNVRNATNEADECNDRFRHCFLAIGSLRLLRTYLAFAAYVVCALRCCCGYVVDLLSDSLSCSML